MLFSIVIPCYNEKENIPLLLERFESSIKEQDRVDQLDQIEVILVDNGSTDGSGQLMDELLEKYPFAVKAVVEVNQGYGYGILTGLRAAKGDFIGWTHADLQTDPSDVVRAVEIIISNGGSQKLFVKGNRKNRPFADVFFTFGMSVLELLLTGRWMKDINAQPNMFSRSFFEQWSEPPHDFSLDLYAFYMAKKHGLEIVRFPVFFPKRIHGSSKWNTGIKSKIKFIRRTAEYSFRMKRNGAR